MKKGGSQWNRSSRRPKTSGAHQESIIDPILLKNLIIQANDLNNGEAHTLRSLLMVQNGWVMDRPEGYAAIQVDRDKWKKDMTRLL